MNSILINSNLAYLQKKQDKNQISQKNHSSRAFKSGPRGKMLPNMVTLIFIELKDAAPCFSLKQPGTFAIKFSCNVYAGFSVKPRNTKCKNII